jgi:ABC-2 type transport system ATP-binding protein
MTNPSIIVEAVSYQYGALQAVNNISFTVGAGEILGFLGPNGAGKSTTVKLLTGQLRPQTGQITLLGMNVAQQAKQIQAQIGVGFETPNLYEAMSGSANLKLFADLFGVRGFDPLPLLQRVGLDGRGNDKVEGYSKGMKQRLMIARALVNQPNILFLDEPTEGLDPTSAQAIRNLIRAEQERGTTVFLTTHDMHEADLLCDRVAFLDQGRIVALDTPHALKQQYGQRMVRAEVRNPDGSLQTREIVLDRTNTPDDLAALFREQQVVTLHSAEATLEDIFMRITGRGLA